MQSTSSCDSVPVPVGPYHPLSDLGKSLSSITNQNLMLTRMNNEATVRRLTGLDVLGKAKVMSFEDIEVARAARTAKEVVKGKEKRGRKRS